MRMVRAGQQIWPEWADLRVGPGHCKRKSWGDEPDARTSGSRMVRDRFIHQGPIRGAYKPVLVREAAAETEWDQIRAAS